MVQPENTMYGRRCQVAAARAIVQRREQRLFGMTVKVSPMSTTRLECRREIRASRPTSAVASAWGLYSSVFWYVALGGGYRCSCQYGTGFG
jgi:hypothetical protein